MTSTPSPLLYLCERLGSPNAGWRRPRWWWPLLGMALATLLGVIYLHARTPSYTAQAALFFPPPNIDIWDSDTTPDLASIPVLNGARILPLPGTSANRAAILLTTRQLLRELATQHPEWAQAWHVPVTENGRPSPAFTACLHNGARVRVGDLGELYVGFCDHDPVLAQQVATAMVGALTARSGILKSNAADETIKYLKRAIADEEATSRAAKFTLSTYLSDHHFSAPETVAASTAAEYARRQEELASAKLEADVADEAASKSTGVAWEQINAGMDIGGPATGPLDTLYRQVLACRAKLAAEEEHKTAAHPDVVAARQALQAAEKRMSEEATRQAALLMPNRGATTANPALATTVKRALLAHSRLEGLRKELALSERSVRSLPVQLTQYSKLKADVEQASARLAIYRSELDKARLYSGLGGAAFSVLTPALIPSDPDGLPALLLLAIIAAIGLTLGSLPLAIQWARTPPKTEWDIARGLWWYNAVRVAMIVILIVALLGVGIIHSITLPGVLDDIKHLLAVALGNAPRFLAIPLLITGTLLGIKFAPQRILKRQQLLALAPMLLLVIYVVVEMILSDSPAIARDRGTVFIQTGLPLLAAVLFFPTPDDWTRVPNVLFYVGCCSVIVLVLTGQLGSVLLPSGMTALTDASRLSVETTTILTSLNLLISALAGILLIISRELSIWRLWLVVLFFLVLLITALATGSRGPIVSFSVALLLILIIANRPLYQKVLIALLFAVVGVAGFLVLERSGAGAALHLLRGTTDIGRESFRSAVLASQPTFFGHGIGSFGYLYWGTDATTYVHNAFLEAYYELGVVGLVLFTFVIAGAWISALKVYLSQRHPGMLFAIVGLTFYFVEAQFSGSLFSMRWWVGFCMLCYLLTAIPLPSPRKVSTVK
jgi:uncharacterized protein involved in exopolysaccharide biosynthesis